MPAGKKFLWRKFKGEHSLFIIQSLVGFIQSNRKTG